MAASLIPWMLSSSAAVSSAERVKPSSLAAAVAAVTKRRVSTACSLKYSSQVWASSSVELKAFCSDRGRLVFRPT